MKKLFIVERNIILHYYSFEIYVCFSKKKTQFYLKYNNFDYIIVKNQCTKYIMKKHIGNEI